MQRFQLKFGTWLLIHNETSSADWIMPEPESLTDIFLCLVNTYTWYMRIKIPRSLLQLACASEALMPSCVKQVEVICNNGIFWHLTITRFIWNPIKHYCLYWNISNIYTTLMTQQSFLSSLVNYANIYTSQLISKPQPEGSFIFTKIFYPRIWYLFTCVLLNNVSTAANLHELTSNLLSLHMTIRETPRI